jgi:hypothetical protein
MDEGSNPSQGLCLHIEQHKRTHYRHPCLEWDSNPRSQRSSERRQWSRFHQQIWVLSVAQKRIFVFGQVDLPDCETSARCVQYRQHVRKCNISSKAFIGLFIEAVSRDSAVGISTGYGLDDWEVGVRVPVGSRIFTSPCCPDRLWGPPNFLYNGFRDLFPGGKAAGAWSCPLTYN